MSEKPSTPAMTVSPIPEIDFESTTLLVTDVIGNQVRATYIKDKTTHKVTLTVTGATEEQVEAIKLQAVKIDKDGNLTVMIDAGKKRHSCAYMTEAPLR